LQEEIGTQPSVYYVPARNPVIKAQVNQS
jgi:hypothetical protein